MFLEMDQEIFERGSCSLSWLIFFPPFDPERGRGQPNQWPKIMMRRFTIYSAFLDIKKCISWYQEFNFLISRNITHFLISKNHFLISTNRFLDIKKCILRRRFTETFLDLHLLTCSLIEREIMSTYLNFLQKLEKCMLISWNISSFVDFILVQ